jgi:hypothetical protein
MHNIPQNGQLRPQQDAIYQDFPPGVRQVNGRHNHILETKGIKITRMRLRDSIHHVDHEGVETKRRGWWCYLVMTTTGQDNFGLLSRCCEYVWSTKQDKAVLFYKWKCCINMTHCIVLISQKQNLTWYMPTFSNPFRMLRSTEDSTFFWKISTSKPSLMNVGIFPFWITLNPNK